MRLVAALAPFAAAGTDPACPGADDVAAPDPAWGRRYGVVHYQRSDVGDEVTGIAVAPDGRLAVAGAGGVRTWAPDGTPRTWRAEEALAVTFSQAPAGAETAGLLWVAGRDTAYRRGEAPRRTALILGLDADGKPVARIAFAGHGDTTATAIAARPDGELVIGGVTRGGLALPGIPPLVGDTGDDAFVARLAPDGAARWAVLVATPAHDGVLDLALGADGSVTALLERRATDAPDGGAPRARITWSAEGVERARADATGVIALAALPDGALAVARNAPAALLRVGPDGEVALPTPPLDGLWLTGVAAGADGAVLAAATTDARAEGPAHAVLFATGPAGVAWRIHLAGPARHPDAVFQRLRPLAPVPLPGGGIAAAGVLQGVVAAGCATDAPVRLEALSPFATDGFLVGFAP